ncbi:MAG: hypothetical protein J0M15_12060 [Deltaproteobacteria bacterium]|nr:hypothetical protein [Deltaproteobacteria bacterium]
MFKKFIMVLFLVTPYLLNAEVENIEVSVMTYNVENLFDNIHDVGKDDETFLPKEVKNNSKHKEKCKKIASYFYRKECFSLDWNDKVLNAKLENIAKVILSVDEGRGPDNLFLTEVENIKILKRLNSDFLKAAKYKTVILIEGKDLRGIDVAFLSRYPLSKKPKLHDIPFQAQNIKDQDKVRKTRGLLDVEVVLPNLLKVRFMGVHLPSQGNPSYLRKQALLFLKELIEKSSNKNLIVGGDFNITAKEEEEDGYFKNQLVPLGKISHLDACQTCRGTHWYKGHWAFLDVLFFNKGLIKDGLKFVPETVKVIKMEESQTKDEKPLRFNSKTLLGSSDHFPIYAKLNIERKSDSNKY